MACICCTEDDCSYSTCRYECCGVCECKEKLLAEPASPTDDPDDEEDDDGWGVQDEDEVDVDEEGERIEEDEG